MPKSSKNLVIDTNILRACGQSQSEHSQKCRELLEFVREKNHSAAVNIQMQKEYLKHASKFGRTWLTKMQSSTRLVLISNEKYQWLLQEILNHSDKSLHKRIKKDFFLIELAMQSDQIIFAMDEAVRQDFCACSKYVNSLRKVSWINPSTCKHTFKKITTDKNTCVFYNLFAELNSKKLTKTSRISNVIRRK
jgi:hypothetical protein